MKENAPTEGIPSRPTAVNCKPYLEVHGIRVYGLGFRVYGLGFRVLKNPIIAALTTQLGFRV